MLRGPWVGRLVAAWSVPGRGVDEDEDRGVGRVRGVGVGAGSWAWAEAWNSRQVQAKDLN